jgi:hypothetical protein
VRQNEDAFFSAVIYRVMLGLHDKAKFFCEIARCKKFFLSGLVFAKILQQ